MKKKFFPWRLFWSFYATIVILFNFLNVLTVFILSRFIQFDFFQTHNFLVLGGFFLISLISAGIIAYRFSLPLRRVILKALRMSNKKLFYELSEEREILDENLFESETGEYFELEQALDQIRNKLRRRREQLAHEREEVQALMSSIEDGVVSTGPDGKIIYFNSGFAAQFLKRDQLPQEEQSLLLTQVIRDPDIFELFDRALKNGLSGSLQKAMTTLLDEKQRVFSITINPLRDPKTKEIFGTMGIFHDITELKKAEKIRIEFVENASHELRTPLTSIKGYLETLIEDFKSGRHDQVGQFLGILGQNVNRLVELVNDLLTISTLENGLNIDLEYIYPDQITADVIEKLAQIASEKKIMVSYRIEDVESIRVDASKLEQVLMNLIGNAIKYTQAGGRVEVIWDKKPESDMIVLHVKDNGPGIAPEHQGRIFERFYRIDKSRSRDIGGTGLGLSIVKHIVQSHGGQVSVKSDLGLGAEFICQFPV